MIYRARGATADIVLPDRAALIEYLKHDLAPWGYHLVTDDVQIEDDGLVTLRNKRLHQRRGWFFGESMGPLYRGAIGHVR